MPTIDIDGCPVEFPHSPYPCQLSFLHSVLHALRDSSHALLESPTGTGKTLGLLCGSLAWRVEEMARRQREVLINPTEFQSDKPPLIIYASRTHSQLSQCIAELKRTTYRPRTAIIGGREQMCLKQGVRELSGAGMGAVCQRLVRRKACEFHQKVGHVGSQLAGKDKQEPEIWDIESLVQFGSKHAACPYYLSRELLKEADLIFMPYNYLLDSSTRAALTTEIDLKGAVVIFDEAHNVESSCYDAVNCELHSDDLLQAIKELEQCKRLLQDYSSGFGVDVQVRADAVDPAIAFLKSLLGKLNSPDFTPLLQERGFHSQPGDAIFALLEGAGFSSAAHERLIKEYEEMGKVLVEDQFTRRSGKRIAWLEVVGALKTIYGVDSVNENGNGSGAMPADACAHEVAAKNLERMTAVMQSARKHYRLVINGFESSNGSSGSGASSTLSITQSTHSTTKQPLTQARRSIAFWCFNPGVVMKDLVERGVRSIILASGTLSPMRSFIQELQLDFKYILENDHVIEDDQVYASVIPTGPSGLPLNSSYASRSSAAYQQELGLTVLRMAECIPEGLLVFFPSYQVMDGCIKQWQHIRHGGETIYNQIAKLKHPLLEPKSKHDLPPLMSHYSKLISEGRGAVMFAVCRGKVSEGLDFADGLARGVIVTGIPYAPYKDPKIILKKQYLQDLPGSTLSGQDWYSQQATRAINQALGRVIRHRRDYGAVLLCDERFGQASVRGQLSRWLRGRVREGQVLGRIAAELKGFFAQRRVSETEKGLMKERLSYQSTQSTPSILMTQSTQFTVDVDSFSAGNSTLTSIPMKSIASSTEGRIKKFDWFSGDDRASSSGSNSNTWVSTSNSNTNTSTQSTIQSTTQSTAQQSLKQAQAQDYLKKVQSALLPTPFSSFKSLLTEFKKGALGVEALLKQISALFQGVKQGGGELFAGFRTFVPEKHRQLHSQILEEMFPSKDGDGSGISLNGKRKLHPECVGRRQIDLEPLYSQSNSSKESNAITLNTTSTSQSLQPTPICPICRDPVSDPHHAKCGHEACLTCWQEWLSRTLECPLCRQRMRIPQLRK